MQGACDSIVRIHLIDGAARASSSAACQFLPLFAPVMALTVAQNGISREVAPLAHQPTPPHFPCPAHGVQKQRYAKFANLPETGPGRWGQGLTAIKMKNCVWLRPELVAQFRFLEWTPDDRLRHVSFISVREDKDPRSVTKQGEPTSTMRKAFLLGRCTKMLLPS